MPLRCPWACRSRSPHRRPTASSSESVSDAPSLRIAAFASEEPVREESSRLRRTFVVVGGPLAIAAILAGWFLARRALAPIDRLTRTASEIARTGRFSVRFTVQTRDELGRLGATFNAMLESLEATYERERSFIGDVSHELRLPYNGAAPAATRQAHAVPSTKHDAETADDKEPKTGPDTDNIQKGPGKTAEGSGENEAPGHEVPDKNERAESNER
jgi:methyl-accepting chemotaxis protein